MNFKAYLDITHAPSWIAVHAVVRHIRRPHLLPQPITIGVRDVYEIGNELIDRDQSEIELRKSVTWDAQNPPQALSRWSDRDLAARLGLEKLRIHNKDMSGLRVMNAVACWGIHAVGQSALTLWSDENHQNLRAPGLKAMQDIGLETENPSLTFPAWKRGLEWAFLALLYEKTWAARENLPKDENHLRDPSAIVVETLTQLGVPAIAPSDGDQRIAEEKVLSHVVDFRHVGGVRVPTLMFGGETVFEISEIKLFKVEGTALTFEREI